MALSAVAARRLAQAALQAASAEPAPAAQVKADTQTVHGHLKAGRRTAQEAVDTSSEPNDDQEELEDAPASDVIASPNVDVDVGMEDPEEEEGDEAFDFLSFAAASSGANTPTAASGRPRKRRKMDM